MQFVLHKQNDKILIDITALGSFADINYQSEDMIQAVTVEEVDLDQHLFRYIETIEFWARGCSAVWGWVSN